MEYKIVIQNGKKLFYPVVEDKVKWETSRKSTPSKLTFKIIKDNKIVKNDTLRITEGNLVRFYVNNKGIFYGFIFSIEEDKDESYTIIAYDQLRYLKNKDSMIYKAITATELLSRIAQNYKLTLGKCADTKYKVTRNEDNATLFDIILNNLDLTLISTGKLYCLWDDFGKLRLSNIENLVIKDLALDADLGESYSYKTSIDSNTYNQVKLGYDNDQTGVREYYIAKDSKTQAKWGVLQYYDKIDSQTGAKEKAVKMLGSYNDKSRHFELKNFKGNIRCRAGRSPIVLFKVHDKEFKNYMLIEKATHTFSVNQHTMDLTLVGNNVFETGG